MAFERVTAEAAYETALKNRSKWQARRKADGVSVASLATPQFKPSFRIRQGEQVFTIGSCFARGIEGFLTARGFALPNAQIRISQEELNPQFSDQPRGVLNKYSPYSMLNEVNAAFGSIDPARHMVETPDGKFLDMQLHTTVLPSTLERAIERRQEINAVNREAISSSRVVVITLGLIETWFDTLSGLHLNYAPPMPLCKRHPGRFQFEVMSPEVTISATRELIELFRRHGHPEQRVILTVSPVPLGRTFTQADSIVANMYSKSALRVAAEVVVREFDHVDYYPSFETVLLSEPAETWEDDGIHVRPAMVKHNVERMLAAYLEPDTAAVA